MTDPAIPAATLVVFRESDGAPDLLMVERARAMAFAGGAAVFPGGRVDDADRQLGAELRPDDPDEGAARIAAIRETVEEVGLAIGLALPTPDAIMPLRAALYAGVPMAAALAEVGGTLDLDALVPFARWRPDHAGMRIYDTRFYLARLPAEGAGAEVDGTENVRLFWTSAADALAAADRGEIAIIFPTRRNLERLTRFADYSAAVADARAHPVRLITPWIERRGERDHLCIPDDLGYPVTAEPVASVRRG